jgi:hypothetical protein
MTGLELLEAYPKAGQVVRQWFLEQMLEGLKDKNLPEDFKKFVREQDIDNDKIGKLIDASPRALFDVFDNHKLYVNIRMSTGVWVWEVNSHIVSNTSSRKEAERLAIEEAFKLLNEKL